MVHGHAAAPEVVNDQVAGVVIILFGLPLTGILKIKALYSDRRMHNVKGGSTAWGAFVIGFAFAFGWTPCVGPILSAILVASRSSGYRYRDSSASIGPDAKRSRSLSVTSEPGE